MQSHKDRQHPKEVDMQKLSAQVRTLLQSAKRQVVNPKYIVGSVTNLSTLLNSTPYVTTLNTVTEGSDETNRVGDKARFNWLKLNFQVVPNSAQLTGCYQIRMMLVKESTCLGSALSLAQFLRGSGTPSVISNQNYVTRDHSRYKVYYDSGAMLIGPSATAVVPAGSSGTIATYDIWNGGSGDNVCRFIHKKLDFTTDYSRGNAGTVSDIDTNSFSLILITDCTQSGAFDINVDYVLEFIDS